MLAGQVERNHWRDSGRLQTGSEEVYFEDLPAEVDRRRECMAAAVAPSYLHRFHAGFDDERRHSDIADRNAPEWMLRP